MVLVVRVFGVHFCCGGDVCVQSDVAHISMFSIPM